MGVRSLCDSERKSGSREEEHRGEEPTVKIRVAERIGEQGSQNKMTDLEKRAMKRTWSTPKGCE